jgi:TolB protein
MNSRLQFATGLFSLIFSFYFIFSTAALGAQIYIPIGEAQVKKSVLAITDIKVGSGSGAADDARTVQAIWARDFNFTGLFTIQNSSAFIEGKDAGITLDAFKLTDWTTIGTEFLLKAVTSRENNIVSLELRLYDVLGGKQILGKRFTAQPNEVTLLGHTSANAVMEALTGRSGMFTSKLAFVCNKTGKKEIYVADFDGQNVRQLTKHGTLAFAPAWSPDGKQLAYSLFTKNGRNVKNIDLYEYDFAKGVATLMTNQKGTNSGAHYSPDGEKIALTMSFLGNQEIFVLNRSDRKVTKLTKSFGFDVDPSWSPDGRKLAFVSSRAGLPMVYSMNADGSNVKRLTFAGKFNATPSWSPDGKKIAFAGWNDGHFDVFLMNADGSSIERLTKDEGSNEDTYFSPDGNFIAFSSNRSGQKNIYAISIDGKTTHRLSFGLGDCEAPKWSQR